MRRKSLILYVLVIVLNLFLFVPIVYTYFILSPIHILIYWLSFDSILSKPSFSSDWHTIRFVGTALICQWALFIILILLNAEDKHDIKAIFSSEVFMFLIGITVIESLVLYFRYSKYISKKAAS